MYNFFYKKIIVSGKKVPIHIQSNPSVGFYNTPNLELFITKQFKIIQINTSPKLTEIVTDNTITTNIQRILNEIKRQVEEQEKPKGKIGMTLSDALKKQQKRLRHSRYKW